jgi:hypothetical protein
MKIGMQVIRNHNGSGSSSVAAEAIDEVRSSGPRCMEHRHPFETLPRRHRSSTSFPATPQAERILICPKVPQNPAQHYLIDVTTSRSYVRFVMVFVIQDRRPLFASIVTVSHADSLMVPLFLCDMLWLDPDFRNPPDVDEPTIRFCLGGTMSGLVGIGIRCSSPYLLRDRVFGWRSVIGTSLHAHVMFRAVLTQLHNRECRPRPIADSAPRRSHASY